MGENNTSCESSKTGKSIVQSLNLKRRVEIELRSKIGGKAVDGVAEIDKVR